MTNQPPSENNRRQSQRSQAWQSATGQASQAEGMEQFSMRQPKAKLPPTPQAQPQLGHAQQTNPEESSSIVEQPVAAAPAEARYSLEAFVDQTRDRDLHQGLFELESPRMLDINLNGEVWLKMGAMVAYTGNIRFEREGILEQGLGNLLKKAVTGEGARLTKASGSGSVFCADSGKKVTILNLNNEAICVNGNDLLAFEKSLSYDIRMMRRISSMMAGGLFNIRLQGKGMVAITSHYDPLTLPVTPSNPVTTDPNATVMWSANLEPSFKTDIQLKTLLGRGSGESFQMEFRGNGFVVVQPYEEVYFQNVSA